MVLEDDAVFAELLAVTLDHAGFEPRIVPDGVRARRLVAEYRADVVAAVCDLQLGHGAPPRSSAPLVSERRGVSNGADVVRALRDLVPDLTAVVMSGHPAAHVREELARVGTEAIVLEKPFRPAALLDLLPRPAQVDGGASRAS